MVTVPQVTIINFTSNRDPAVQIMAAVEVLQLLQALPFQKADTETVVTGTTTDLGYGSRLESTLTVQENLIIDFTSLKTCLDPTNACDDTPQQQTVSLALSSS